MPYQQNRNRVIGTIEERIAVLNCARYVIEAMKNSGHFQGIDLESLSTTADFARAPPPPRNLFLFKARNESQNHETSGKHLENLVKRSLVHDDPEELAATIYHEYLHAILGMMRGTGRHSLLWRLCGP